MALVLTLGKIMNLLSCGWSTPCAIAFVSRDLVEGFHRLWAKTFSLAPAKSKSTRE
jgi:hypothetical protein